MQFFIPMRPPTVTHHDKDLHAFMRGGKPCAVLHDSPAPPIGRCKDCAHSSPRMVMGNKTYGKVCKIDPYLVHEVNPDGYCDGFKPKEAPND